MFSEKPLDMVNKSPNSGPSIMKKRGYEQTNGIDGGMYFIIWASSPQNLSLGFPAK